MTESNGLLLFGVGLLVGLGVATLLFLVVNSGGLRLGQSQSLPTYVPITKSLKEG